MDLLKAQYAELVSPVLPNEGALICVQGLFGYVHVFYINVFYAG